MLHPKSGQNKHNEFDAEFEAIKPALLSYFYRLAANREDAEDLLHDTYLKSREKIDGFRAEGTFKSWVFTIGTRLAIDHKRVKNRWPENAQDRCKSAATENEQLARRMVNAFENQTEQRFDIAEHIHYCFTCLAKNLELNKQLVLVLKEVYQFKVREIAQIVGLTQGVVKHVLLQGRRELQTKYENRCALINKNGVCYQCAELNNYFEKSRNAEVKIGPLGFLKNGDSQANFKKRMSIIQKINPINGNGALLEDTILQILRESIGD